MNIINLYRPRQSIYKIYILYLYIYFFSLCSIKIPDLYVIGKKRNSGDVLCHKYEQKLSHQCPSSVSSESLPVLEFVYMIY